MLPMATPLSFLRETRDEMKKVVWPTQTEIIRLTGIVIIVSVMVGLFIGGLDFLLTTILTRTIG